MPRTTQQTFDAAAGLGGRWPLVRELHSDAPFATKWQIMWYLTDLSRLYFEMGVVASNPDTSDDDVRNCWLRATLEPDVYEDYLEHMKRLREKKAKEEQSVSVSNSTDQ